MDTVSTSTHSLHVTVDERGEIHVPAEQVARLRLHPGQGVSVVADAPPIELLGDDEPSIEQQLAEQGKTDATDLSGIGPLFASDDERRAFLALIGRNA